MTQTGKGIAVLALAALTGLPNPARADDAPALVPNENSVIFAIGTEDEAEDEFKGWGWGGISEYACTLGVDCAAATFPRYFAAGRTADANDMLAVTSVLISFSLATAVDELVLVVPRFGIEPSVVRFDGEAPVTVTPEMMDPPSAEDVWGRFELPLGAAAAGPHRIALSVLDDGSGNGRHVIDAIILMAAGPPS